MQLDIMTCQVSRAASRVQSVQPDTVKKSSSGFSFIKCRNTAICGEHRMLHSALLCWGFLQSLLLLRGHP